MRFAIVIPARLASSRLPRKMLLAETGQPLICHTVAAAAAAHGLAPEIFGEIVVAADDAEVVAAVNEYADRHHLAARAEMTRPDHHSGSDRVAEVASRLPETIDAIINLQGDEPEIEASTLVALARCLEDHSAADIATLVYPIFRDSDFRDPNLVKAVIDENGFALYFSRAPLPFDRDTPPPPQLGWGHVGVYAYRRLALQRFVALPPTPLEKREKLEQLRALGHGMRIVCLMLSSQPAKGIDTAADYDAFVARWRKGRLSPGQG